MCISKLFLESVLSCLIIVVLSNSERQTLFFHVKNKDPNKIDLDHRRIYGAVSGQKKEVNGPASANTAIPPIIVRIFFAKVAFICKHQFSSIKSMLFSIGLQLSKLGIKDAFYGFREKSCKSL